MRFIVILIALLPFFYGLVDSTQPDAISSPLISRGNGDLCAAVDISTVIVGGRLFFSGGQYSFVNGDNLAAVPELFYIDLQDSFPAGGNLLQSNFSSISVPSGLNFSDQNQVLFNDNTTIYFYDPDLPSGIGEMWAYNVSTNTFSDMKIGGNANIPALLPDMTRGYVASDPATGHSYYGGSISADLVNSTGLLQTFDSSTSHIQWLKTMPNSPRFYQGQMVYVRAGAEGVLVAFGGLNINATELSTIGNSMAEIFVFDIASSTWFTVNATGDVPPPTANFCSGVSSAPDDSSFQITIFAGAEVLVTEDGTFDRSAVYVLTLPAFKWINVTSTSNPNNNLMGREQNACSVWNDAQMISIGGFVSNSSGDSINRASCSSSAPPLLVLDLTTFLFKSEFDPDEIYAQPEAVWRAIGGGPAGGADLKQPTGGFNDSRLNTIFAKRVPRTTAPTSFPTSGAAATSPASTKSASTNPPAPKHSSSNLSAIFGGAIGGLAILFIILGVGMFCIKRHRQRRKASIQQSKPVFDTHDSESCIDKPLELGGVPLPTSSELSGPSLPTRQNSTQKFSEVQGSDTRHELLGSGACHELQGSSGLIYEL